MAIAKARQHVGQAPQDEAAMLAYVLAAVVAEGDEARRARRAIRCRCTARASAHRPRESSRSQASRSGNDGRRRFRCLVWIQRSSSSSACVRQWEKSTCALHCARHAGLDIAVEAATTEGAAAQGLTLNQKPLPPPGSRNQPGLSSAGAALAAPLLAPRAERRAQLLVDNARARVVQELLLLGTRKRGCA